jgi:hypothetical protein
MALLRIDPSSPLKIARLTSPAPGAFYRDESPKQGSGWLIARFANFWGGFFHPSAMLRARAGA